MCEDSELLSRYARQHSEEAFAELVRRHVDLLYAVALRKVGGDTHLAKDAVQQVFVGLARKAESLSRHPALLGWLFTSTHFAASQLVRSERRRRAREEMAHLMNETASTTGEEAIDWNHLRLTLDDLVRGLNERDRAVVLLRFFAGRTLSEVGSTLGMTENGARSRIDRALEKLRSALARRGVRSTSAALASALAIQTGIAAPPGLSAAITQAAVTGTALTTSFGTGAWGLLNIMSTTKIISGLAFIAAIGLGFAVYETAAHRASAAAADALTRERDSLRSRVAMLERRTTQSNAALNAANREIEHLQTAANAPAPAGFSVGRLEYALDHPEARSALLARAALTIKVRFDRFFRSAGLTGEQQDKFMSIVMSDADGRLEALALRRAAGGLGPDAPPMDPAAIAEIGSLQQQKDAQTLASFKSLLGDKFPAAMRFLNTMSERNTADELASQLYYTETPLTGQQAEELVKALAQNQFRAQDSASPANTMGGTFIPREIYNGALAQAGQQDFPWMADKPITDAALPQAATFLTSSQMAALALLQARQAAELQTAPPKRRIEAKK